MIEELTSAQKLDALLKVSKEYNLKETGDPATYNMDCGNGYTLFASVDRSWYFSLDGGAVTTKYDVDSSKVPYTNAKDARSLYAKYMNECNISKAEPRENVEFTGTPQIENRDNAEQDAVDKKLIAALSALLGCDA